MHLSVICRILGILLMLFSVTQLVPFLLSLYVEDGAQTPFLAAFAITLISGALLWLPVYNRHYELRTRDGFLITSLFWTVLGLYGALPFALATEPHLSVADAIFESISGLTTTGATVITGLDDLPTSILFYRHQLQWLGGIGIIVIAVAVLPLLGIGGMQLYRAETPGPMKESKLSPQITGTAKILFFLYLGLTAVCAVAFNVAGMTPFDAICHAFSTVAIGGFSTHDASIGYFDSPAIMLICSVFMVIAGINFGLHFAAFRGGRLSHYLNDSETRFYLITMAMCCLMVSLALWFYQQYDLTDALLQGIFQTVSMSTTTGFATTDFSAWPTFLPVFLILLSCIGGCAGSTGGGMKAIRVFLIFLQGFRELKQLVHPNAVIPLKVNNRRVPAKVVSAVWSFFAVYMFVFLILLIALMAAGLDYQTAFSATAAGLNNLGPGLGDVAYHYGDISAAAKGLICIAMLLGRLEIFTLLVLFTPAFWRR